MEVEESLLKSKEMSALIEKYKELGDMIKSTSDKNERENLESQRQECLFEMQEFCLKDKLIKEGLSDDLINAFASLETKRDLFTKEKKEKESNKYDLSSEYIVSNKTGETINVKYTNYSDKIKMIYEHTGEIVSYHDPVLVNKRDQASETFVIYITSTMSHKKLKQKYGDNWKDEIGKIYKQCYDECMKEQISKAVEEVDEKNKPKDVVMESQEEVASIKKENEELKSELNDARSKINQLVEQISEMQKSNKDDLQQYRDALASVVKNNAKQQNSFEYTPEEKSKIIQALGICFIYDDNDRNVNVNRLAILPGAPIEQTARQMMICKNLGINVTANHNEQLLDNTVFENEQQIVDTYSSMIELGRPKNR